MVITLVVPMRKIFGLSHIITVDHFERLAKLMLLTSLIVTYAYAVEWALALYSGNVFEEGHFLYRLVGDYKELYWLMVFCNCIAPATVFIRSLRRNLVWLFILSLPVIGYAYFSFRLARLLPHLLLDEVRPDVCQCLL